MNYLRLPHMDDQVSIFDIAQAHQQLEADYNKGGWVRERPSNQRRMEATSCQLSRIGYNSGYRWVEIIHDDPQDDDGDNNVRDIYLINVLKWGLPMDDEMRAFMAKRFVARFLESFPSWSQK